MNFYLEEMDWKDVQNALSTFDMEKKSFDKLMDWIWEKNRKPFEVF